MATKAGSATNGKESFGGDELTHRVWILGITLSVVMAAANVYLGLRVGMTASASIPAAVMAMVFFRRSKSKNRILEANQVQTAASAGESIAAGVIFTIPAMIFIGAWKEFDMFQTALIGFTGGLLGILLMIPMRKVFVTNKNMKLAYPEGMACAKVLEVGDSQDAEMGKDKARLIFNGALLGGLLKICISFIGIVKGILEQGFALGGRVMYFGADISPALVGVGAITGFNVAAVLFLGGVIGWMIVMPLVGVSPGEGSALDQAWAIWSSQVRYVGVGTMVVGGVATIFKVRESIVVAIKEITSRSIDLESDKILTERNLSPNTIKVLTAVCLAGIAYFYYTITHKALDTVIVTAVMLLLAFFFTAVASYIVGLVGNSNCPVSGMAITTVLAAGLLFSLMGYEAMDGMVATLGAAAIVCCVACTSGDVCNDLKTGHLVGATPYRQQVMQVVGLAVAALTMAPVLQLLHNNTPGGIGGKELSAPQAALFASLADGFFGSGQIPWYYVSIGAAIGFVVLIGDYFLGKRNSSFRLYIMPLAIGIYLPFGISVPLMVGGIIEKLVKAKGKKKGMSDHDSMEYGVLCGSGLIAGESLTGILIAGLAAGGVANLNLGLTSGIKTIVTLAVSAGFTFWFYRSTSKRLAVR